MKEFLLAVCMLMAGVFVWFLCRSWDNFLDKYRKAQKSIGRTTCRAGMSEYATGAAPRCVV